MGKIRLRFYQFGRLWAAVPPMQSVSICSPSGVSSTNSNVIFSKHKNCNHSLVGVKKRFFHLDKLS